MITIDNLKTKNIYINIICPQNYNFTCQRQIRTPTRKIELYSKILTARIYTVNSTKFKLFIYLGYKSGERDSSSEAKAQANNIENLNNGQSAAVILTSNMNGNNTLGNNFLYLSDDELRNLIDTTANDEYPALIGHLLDIFRRYRIIFTCSTLVEMFLSFGLTFITWEKRETAITVMADIYPEINSREAAISFYILFFTTLALNIVYYPFGYYALARKSVRLMRVFSFFILFNAMFILLSINIDMYYIDLFNQIVRICVCIQAATLWILQISL